MEIAAGTASPLRAVQDFLTAQRSPLWDVRMFLDEGHQGLLVALWLEPDAAAACAIPDGEPPEQLHITLCYCPQDTALTEEEWNAVVDTVKQVATDFPALDGAMGGTGRFGGSLSSDSKDVGVLLPDVPGLTTLREAIAGALVAIGLTPSMEHGYTPHTTLKYLDAGELWNPELPAIPLSFPAITVKQGVKSEEIPLATAVLTAGEWDESKHPRSPSGSPAGGEFASGGDTPTWWPTAAERFLAERNKSARPGFLSHLSASDLSAHRLLTAHQGRVGVALSPQGDIQNLFNNGGPKGAGVDALAEAIDQGGRTLDCYDGYLPKLYTQLGMVETGRMAFNREFAPPGWDYARLGQPDVVFMAWKGWPQDDKQGSIERAKAKSGGLPLVRSARLYNGAQWDRAKLDARRAANPPTGRRGSWMGLHEAVCEPHPGSGASDRQSVTLYRAVEAFVSGVAPLMAGEFDESKHPRDSHTGEWTTLYHGTTADRVDAITKEGLRPPEHVGQKWFMLTSKKEVAEEFAHGYQRTGTPVVMEYRIPASTKRYTEHLWPGAALNYNGSGDHQYAIRKAIPQKYLVKVHSMPLTAGEWEESKHPRNPPGSPAGGEFTSGAGGDSGVDVTSKVRNRQKELDRILEEEKVAVAKLPAAFVEEMAKPGIQRWINDHQYHTEMGPALVYNPQAGAMEVSTTAQELKRDYNKEAVDWPAQAQAKLDETCPAPRGTRR